MPAFAKREQKSALGDLEKTQARKIVEGLLHDLGRVIVEAVD